MTLYFILSVCFYKVPVGKRRCGAMMCKYYEKQNQCLRPACAKCVAVVSNGSMIRQPPGGSLHRACAMHAKMLQQEHNVLYVFYDSVSCD